ncbi:MAG: alpha/beta hydrolase [Pseudolabrys sp.]|nr:alpha/beta hydrolase [Pseudolabrys sp.]
MADTQAVTGRVVSGDVDIFYRKFGKPGRTPVLIVHGLSFFSYDWIGVAARLAADREVAAIDMRGFGQSGWSPGRDYKLETLSKDVIAVLDALGWDKAVLMGHSFGGRVCLATAGWNRERASALVCVDFAPDLAPQGRRHVAERIGRQPDVFASVDDAMAYHGETAGDAPRRQRWQEFLRKENRGFVLRRDLHYRDNFKRALEAGQSAPVPAFLWPMLADMTIPALLIRATESDMFDAATLQKALALNPRLKGIELPGSHDLAGDNPEGLADAVTRFLATVKL